MSTKIQLFPPNTDIYEPDAIHRVVIQFPTENDAIVFFEWCRQICQTQSRENGAAGEPKEK